LLSSQVLELCKGAPQVAGAERHGVGHIGGDRRNAYSDKHWKRYKSSSAGQSVYGSPGDCG
jgi:hypothetical protein